MKKFEYKETIIVVSHVQENSTTWRKEGLLFTQLNEYGQNGWQVVYMKETVIHVAEYTGIYHVILMRKVTA